MNPRRLHNRLSFYKHTSAATGKIVLATRKLRWSNPTLFNDLHDVPTEILDEVDPSKLQSAFADRMVRLVENPSLPFPERQSYMTRMVLDGLSRADGELKSVFLDEIEAFRLLPPAGSLRIQEMQEVWRATYPDQRIICFTEQWDSSSMWDRYSDANRGIVLEFRCIDELDTVTLAAEPMTYSDDALKYNTSEGFAELSLYEPQHAIRMMLHEYTHTKSTDWAPEKEWRIASSKRPGENGDFSDYSFFSEEITSVIFGARITDEDRNDVIMLIENGEYKDVTMFQAEVSGRKLKRRKIPKS